MSDMGGRRISDPIVAVDVVPGKLNLARRVGATHVVEVADDPVAAIRIRDLTGSLFLS
jgi:Zn-dependent alcohol dehydrogenase